MNAKMKRFHYHQWGFYMGNLCMLGMWIAGIAALGDALVASVPFYYRDLLIELWIYNFGYEIFLLAVLASATKYNKLIFRGRWIQALRLYYLSDRVVISTYLAAFVVTLIWLIVTLFPIPSIQEVFISFLNSVQALLGIVVFCAMLSHQELLRTINAD